jgi:molybdopterin-guanine dinucleotide biosynthesis protein A
MAAPPAITSAIVAGGEARRFGGRPKGLESVGGRRILDIQVDLCVAAFGAPPFLIANHDAAIQWRPDLRVVPDVLPGLGALGGILTAVRMAPAPVLVLAWDLPFLTSPLLQALAGGLAGADACLPASPGPRGLEPLCAAYGPATLAAIEAAVAVGDRRAVGFHDRIKTSILSPERVGEFGDPATLFFNVNTVDDLAEADRIWRKRASSR